MPHMPRLKLAALSLLPLVSLAAAPPALGQAAAQNRHFRSGNLTRSCTPCHAGHGISRTPLLRVDGDQLCLGCHSAAIASPAERTRLGVGANARPSDIKGEMAKAYAHGKARCLDCHSAHFGSASTQAPVSELALGIVKPSPRRGFKTEADLCLSCHGSRGPLGQDTTDLSARFLATNPSFHPVLAQGKASSVPSLKPPLTTAILLNCTDCHGSDTPNGPKGPHGSRNVGLLAQECSHQDGQAESATTYSLCYACHDRTIVLGKDAFPDHAKHVKEEKTPCALCHDPHGTASARALIRFNEATPITGVTPAKSGKLQFVSTAPGSGSCYLTCHGKNHDPLSYGPGSRGIPPPASLVERDLGGAARALGSGARSVPAPVQPGTTTGATGGGAVRRAAPETESVKPVPR